ncbi:ATP-binding cassette domain-containing protein [Glaciecola sp. XM2]|uniref:ABC transporter transmembrane domain-containing protein n=1 Tax=Glaciecola sp. XM2 TaxID=1914931 RepID=UPI001BDDE083|nr:ATP-binding cassette domain-containing protein [Glaciecola sp. XM2]
MKTQYTSSHILKWLFNHLRPYKWQVIGALTALGVGALTWLLLGQGIRYVIDKGFMADNQAVLTQALWVVIAVVVIGSIATYIRFYLMVWLGERVSADIRKALFNHLVTLSPAFYAQSRTGEIISRFTSDTTLLQSVVGTGVSMALRSTVMFIGALVLMGFTSLKLTLFVFIAVPFILAPIRLLGARVRAFSKESQDKVADIGGVVDESLHEIHMLQAFNHEKRSMQTFSSKIDEVMHAASKRIHYRALLISTVMLISLSAIFFIGYLGAIAVIEGTISQGQLVAFVFYAVLAGGAIATISEVIGELQKAAGASERILDLMSETSAIEDLGTTHAIANNSDVVMSVEDIHFAYESTPVIKGISFDVNIGDKVAIVGHSGAGKSTLFDLLMRFYDVNSGVIRVQGHEQKSLGVETLRNQFALVSQDPVIFATSVSENIAFGREHASHEEIVEAAKLAHADEFIRELNQGYDTDLGERGIKLSGGQKQRIAIARAILAKRPILLLDEATSALDAGSEKLVKQAIDSLMQSTTTLIIAHRLSTVLNADKILVLEKGRCIAQGTHQSLYESNDTYREFVDLQLTQ